MKATHKMRSHILAAGIGAVIGFAASANAGDVNIAPPRKPAFDTVITPGQVPGKDIQHGHHHKGDVKKNKSRDDEELKQTGKAGGQS
ncbi:hypothetical protein BCF11_4835 [Collimonas sp. PA-H2]|uniref:hypothetical protein n=1 Tax=Collimonas sp. PA-H2 TaxID=1881062 RepID=UPI000C003A4B|nr:hypothetical protein [Collimonas sp. PA-H2]PFH12356.1 hypothetical protein BCF11_4835 [Collimonas sp. PA-H2]